MRLTSDSKGAILRIGVLAVTMIVISSPQAAHAADPFANATAAASSIQASLQRFATALGSIGVLCCLILGYFNKLNWKWLSTALGTSFAIAVVPDIISYVSSFA